MSDPRGEQRHPFRDDEDRPFILAFGVVPHTCVTLDPACFRCQLNMDEVAAQKWERRLARLKRLGRALLIIALGLGLGWFNVLLIHALGPVFGSGLAIAVVWAWAMHVGWWTTSDGRERWNWRILLGPDRYIDHINSTKRSTP